MTTGDLEAAAVPPPVSVAVPEPARSRRDRDLTLAEVAPWLALGLVLLAQALLLAHYYAPAIADPDANGYWAQGSLLARTGRTWYVPESDVQYVGMHWLVTADGRYFSRYPPGLAVLVALVYRLWGYEAAVLINPTLAVLGLLGMFLLGRQALGPWWGVMGALALGLTPDYTRHALQSDSHMAVTALLIWGMWLLWRWHEGGRWPNLFGAGIVLGAIPTVRYPEALFALGVGALLLLHCRRQPRRWPHVAIGLLGALLPLGPLLLRNQLAFGAFWRTAYSLTHEQTGFSWNSFQAHAGDYLQALTADGVGLFFGLGLVGMTLMWFRRDLRPWAAFLTLTVVPITLLYMAYYWAPGRFGREAAAMRFLLPTFPCYYLAAMGLLQALSATLPTRAVVTAATVMLACHAALGIADIVAGAARQSYSRRALATLTRALHNHLPSNAVIISSQPVLQHLDFVRRWRCADISVLRPRPGGPGRRLPAAPDGPAPMQAEKRRIESEKYSGQGDFGRERAIAYDLREWAAATPVYFVGSVAEMERLASSYFGSKYLREISRIEMPPAPARGGAEPGMGRLPAAGAGPGGAQTAAALPAWAGGGGPNPAPLPGGGPGTGGGPFAGRGPRPPGGGGLLGLSPDVREIVVGEWLWQPAGPR